MCFLLNKTAASNQNIISKKRGKCLNSKERSIFPEPQSYAQKNESSATSRTLYTKMKVLPRADLNKIYKALAREEHSVQERVFKKPFKNFNSKTTWRKTVEIPLAGVLSLQRKLEEKIPTWFISSQKLR